MEHHSQTIPIIVPQLGEGLREAVVLQFLKQVGDSVKEGDALFEVETEKAITSVEASNDGVLAAWRVAPGTLVAIGAEVGAIMPGSFGSLRDPNPVRQELNRTPAVDLLASPAPLRNDQLPPRTRTLLRRHQLLGQADQIPRHGDKLLPGDVERFVAAQTKIASELQVRPAGVRPLTIGERWQAHRFQGPAAGISAMLELRVAWAGMEARLKQGRLDPQAESRLATVVMAWCIAQAMRAHPLFRTRLNSESECQTYASPAVGIAIAAPGAALAIASVPHSEQWAEFHSEALQRIENATSGRNQVTPETTVILSNLMPYRIHRAVPAVIAPAVATIFVGDVSWVPTGQAAQVEFARMFHLSMTFDHRLINGAPAAQFLHEVATRMETLSDLGPSLPVESSDAPLMASPVEDGVRRLISELHGIPPSLVDMEAKVLDLARDSLGFVSADFVCEDVLKYLTVQCPRANITLEIVRNKSLKELICLTMGTDGRAAPVSRPSTGASAAP